MVPGLPRSVGLGLVCIAAPQGSGLGTIEHGAGPIELVGLLEPSAKRIWCNFSQTPARCQALRNSSRQVMPQPQPISWGNFLPGDARL